MKNKKLGVSISSILLVVLAAATLADESRPNVLIVLVDDFGWGDPSCYGNTLIATPNIDRMADEGIRFSQGYVASPICSPSRCGIITGQFPARWRITSYLQTRKGNRECEMVDFLDPSAPSLPRMLHNAGYATAHIGKWHLGGGRDVIDAPKFAAYGYDVGLGTYESPEPASALGLKTVPWGPADQREEQQVPRHERSHWMIDQTLAFMQSHREQPCFVNLWLDDTHTPFVPSEEQIKRVRVNGDGERKTNYKAVLANLDKEIGRLLSGLASTNTLVVFLGDNGASPPFERERSAGLRGQKLSLYEGGTRIPFITWWSANKMPKIVNETSVVSSIDLLPSLASLCQAKLPQNYVSDGEDMSMAFRGALQRRSKPLHWEYGRNNTSFVYPMDEKHRSPNLALRDGNWKLLINADGTGPELYDLKKDPNETTNLSNEQSVLTHELSSKALAWRKSLP